MPEKMIRPGGSSIEGGRRRLPNLLLLVFLLTTTQNVKALESFYANVTLKASNGDLSAVVYLPRDLKPGERTYYVSSRFDWSSMIGSIERTTTHPITLQKTKHTLYGTKQWRLPHDPYWAESGVGLASEFGVGTDGALCNFMCGWDQENEVTNGVLGYQEAKSGESFLKIGVGELVKGSCATCDSAEDYKFNSPYRFARPPVWTLEYTDDSDDEATVTTSSIKLTHKAVLGDGQHGYKLEKVITLNDDQLLVQNSLTNLGRDPFSTAWYSHHFFSCDAHPVQYGYSADFDLATTNGRYNEPSTWSWSTPLEEYATVHVADDEESNNEDMTRIEMQRGVESNVRIKAEFVKDETSRGTFSLRACNTQITESIPEVGDGDIHMYAYNLYIESGTFSPEPQILLSLQPGQTKTWTQQLDFSDHYPLAILEEAAEEASTNLLLQKLMGKGTTTAAAAAAAKSSTTNSTNRRRSYSIGGMAAFALVLVVVVRIHSSSSRTATTTETHTTGRRRRSNYIPVPDVDADERKQQTTTQTDYAAI